jgi:hypothetical protein
VAIRIPIFFMCVPLWELGGSRGQWGKNRGDDHTFETPSQTTHGTICIEQCTWTLESVGWKGFIATVFGARPGTDQRSRRATEKVVSFSAGSHREFDAASADLFGTFGIRQQSRYGESTVLLCPYLCTARPPASWLNTRSWRQSRCCSLPAAPHQCPARRNEPARKPWNGRCAFFPTRSTVAASTSPRTSNAPTNSSKQASRRPRSPVTPRCSRFTGAPTATFFARSSGAPTRC